MNKIFTLKDQEIHVWSFDIKQDIKYFSQYQSILDAFTLDKINKFYHFSDRNRALLSAIIARLLLAKYLNILPELVKFKYNQFDKPYHIDNSIYFNISHAKNKLLIAFAKNELGIDVEYIDPKYQFLEVIPKVFTDTEQSIIMTTNPQDRCKVFFRFWTQKESIIKALGTGFSLDPKTLDISKGYYQKWQITNLSINNQEYQFCIAHKIADPQISYFSKQFLWLQ